MGISETRDIQGSFKKVFLSGKFKSKRVSIWQKLLKEEREKKFSLKIRMTNSDHYFQNCSSRSNEWRGIDLKEWYLQWNQRFKCSWRVIKKLSPPHPISKSEFPCANIFSIVVASTLTNSRGDHIFAS